MPSHESDGKSLFDLRRDLYGRKILAGMPDRIGRKDRGPFDAADFFLEQRRRKTIDALLGFLVENLVDFFREQDLSPPEGQHGLLGAVNGPRQVQASGLEQVFLGKIGAFNLVMIHKRAHV